VARSIYRPPWRIDVDVRPAVRLPSGTSVALLARAAARTLDATTAPRPGSIGLILSDDAELAALNQTHMGKRGPTDVLSFPLDPSPGFVLPPGRRPHLGDVVVSVERAREQAEAGRGGQTGDVRGSAADELRLLVTHGVLHVCGWDHATPDEEAAMRALERRLLG
jgi:probable rRNA maturation factor